MVYYWYSLRPMFTAEEILFTVTHMLDNKDSAICSEAEAHRQSALQAIEAAKKGNYEQNLRVALGHLRDIYDLLCIVAKRGPRWYEWLDHYSGGVIYSKRACSASKSAVEVATMISKGHLVLGETANANAWANRARDVFEKYHELSLAICLKGIMMPGVPGVPNSRASLMKPSSYEVDNRKGLLGEQRDNLETLLAAQHV
ncbi:MAG: hypothetical protein M3X11_25140 [Acidobacteriota bacterium]|nr:hypothetical protein [Acidobacteriota bacterium]